MSSREIALWVDERWYQALSRQLGDETVEDRLNKYLDKLIDQLPEEVREKISGEFGAEDQRREQEMEATQKFSAFRVTEHGLTEHFRVEGSFGMLAAAGYVRTCLRRELGPRPFRDMLHNREEISAGEFDRMASSCMEEGSRVTNVYDVDFDKREFSAVRPAHGWVSYRLKDVSTAVWHADRCSSYDWNLRQNRLMEKLEGKEIAPAGQLSVRDFALAEDAQKTEEQEEHNHGPEMAM